MRKDDLGHLRKNPITMTMDHLQYFKSHSQLRVVIFSCFYNMKEVKTNQAWNVGQISFQCWIYFFCIPWINIALNVFTSSNPFKKGFWSGNTVRVSLFYFFHSKLHNLTVKMISCSTFTIYGSQKLYGYILTSSSTSDVKAKVHSYYSKD